MQQKVDLGVQGLKVLDEPGQPLAGDAGQGADSDQATVQALQLPGLFQHGVVVVDRPLDVWKEGLSLRGQLDAVAGAVEQLQRQL